MSVLDPDALKACVRCGLCLSACPTFRLTGMEGYSPRGRIAVARSLASGGRASAVTREYLDTCLGCLACEATCPSGVRYGEILEHARERDRRTGPARWVKRTVLLWVVARRWRLSVASLPLWLLQRLRLTRTIAALARRRVIPRALAALDGVPAIRFSHLSLRMGTNYVPPDGTAERGQLVLFAGCVQDAWYRDVHWATIAVLTKLGYRVRVPRGQVCCGALHAHDGRMGWARRLARRNLRPLGQFDGEIVVNAAGCGAKLKRYGSLLGTGGASDLAGAVRDVHEVVDAEALRALEPSAPEGLRRVAVHDPCHLRHGQGVVAQPRELLRAAGYEVVELDDAGTCCGAAGTYATEHPEWAEPLRDDRLEAVAKVAPDAVAVANPGCAMWMSAPAGTPPMLHPIQLVALALV